MSKIVRRGEIYTANLTSFKGSEQGGNRPVLVIQNNAGNYHSPTTIIAPISTKKGHKKLPVHVNLGNCGYCLEDGSKVLLEQIRVIDKSRLTKYICSLYDSEMANVDRALLKSIGLFEEYGR
jgi:mRNA interferase MazF